MARKGARYRFVLVEDPGTTLPVRYCRRRPSPAFWVRRTEPMEALLEAFLRLSRRGEGAAAWAPALSENPLTFLLDTVSDAVMVREQGGGVVYANTAARILGVSDPSWPGSFTALEDLEREDGRYQRRCMSFRCGTSTLVVEVVRRLS